MKVINFDPEGARDTLHIEAPGCVINIMAPLWNTEGNQVTRIEILVDQYVGEEWELPDFGDAKHLSFRVVKKENASE